MDRVRSMVVGVDFSDSSRRAVEQAARLARANDARIVLFHVVSEPAQSYLESDAAERLAELAGEVGVPENATFEVAVGAHLPEALRLIRAADADLLVLGVYGPLGEFTGSGIGVFATQCVRHVPCKVLAVHENLRGNLDRLLACVDFSATSLRALESAIGLARQESGELHVLHVPGEDDDEEDVVARLEEAVGGLAEDADSLDVRYRVGKPRDPRDAIIGHARELDVDLIAMGTKGQTDVEYLLLGSTAERVLRAVRRSVLIAKPEGFVPPAER